MKKILTKIRELTKKQKIILCSCVAVVLVSTSVGIVLHNQQDKRKQALLEAQQEQEKPPVIVIEEPKEEALQETVEEVVEETPQTRNISFTGTSIEKDLKIKIVDEQKKLVSGSLFQITVTSKDGKSTKDYDDHDKDGIIYIKNIEAGQYTVRLHDIDGFEIAKNSISVTVKDKIEYKKVDVSNEIKQATEVNIKKEDKPVEKPKEEVKIVDTTKLVDSTVKENPVKKENVDTTQFPKASAGEKKLSILIRDGVTIHVPEEVALYNFGVEDARTFLMEFEVSDEEQNIQGISWKADKEEIFTFEEKEENKILLTARAKGEAKLCATITYQSVQQHENSLENDNEVKPEGGVENEGDVQPEVGTEGDTSKETQNREISIRVVVSDYVDGQVQLKDKSGNPLYLDKEAKQPATPKDYVSAEQFYTTPTYTGWQKIGDSSYYYDENHKLVTGVQVIGGARYHFGEDGKLLKNQEQKGIDISKWQGKIDWEAVANAGIDFAIIRVGNRGSSTGVLIEDPYFKKNIEGATKAGIKVGVYLYSQAITEAEAIEEASMALSLVKGYKLQLPIYFDTEFISGGRANSLSVSARTSITKAFCETIRNAGYMAGIYSNYYWLRDNLKMSELEMYSIWVAHYADKCGYPGKYDMWQYTSSGSVPGIKGDVDLNISYVGY